MIWHGHGDLEIEIGEPALRSCWECNPAHEHLKRVNWLHCCFSCGRLWIFDKFLNGFETDAALDAFLRGRGLEPGQSTITIDAGYRIMCAEVAHEQE
jgi:hypothetical protein